MDKILVVEKDDDVEEKIIKILKGEGYDVVATKNFKAAKTAFNKEEFDTVLLDFGIFDDVKIEVLKYVKSPDRELPLVIIAGKDNFKDTLGAIKEGAYDYILKPVKRNDLSRVINRAVERKHLTDEKNKLEAEKKELEKSIEIKSDRLVFFEGMVNNFSDAICVSDNTLKIVATNPAIEKITGYTVEDMVGKSVHSMPMIDKEGVKAIMKEMPKLKKGMPVENMELEIIHKSGKRIPCLSSAAMIKDDNGKMKGIVVSVRDITDLKNLMKGQEDATEFFRSTLDNLSDAVCIFDKTMRIIDVNLAIKELMGYEKEDVIGKRITELDLLDKNEMKKVMKESVPQLLKGVAHSNTELDIKTKDGRKMPALISSTPIKDSNGNISRIVISLRDITDLKNLMNQQEKAAKYLENNVKRMLEVTTAAASGDLSKRVKKERDDDVGALADGLNYMVDNVDRMIKEQEKAAKYLENNVKRMLEVTTAAASGNLSKRVKKERDDDVGALADGLNNMIHNIEKVMIEQEEAAKYLKSNVRHMLDVVTATATGDLTKRVEKERDDDVGALADGINYMILNVDQMIKKQEDQRKYLEENSARLGVALQDAANGDLSQRLEKEREDEIGEVMDAYNKTVIRLSDIVTSNIKASNRVFKSAKILTETSREMNRGMEGLAMGSSQIAEGAQKLSNIVQKTATSINEASSILKETDGTVTRSSEEGKAAIQVSKEVQSAAKDAGVSFEKIRESVAETSESVGKMSLSINKVTEMGDVITDVASQTNMLALNASIESARAGEAGRGFAIVAEAVKDLAEQVKNATRESICAVEEIKASGKYAISVSSDADNEAEEGEAVLLKALKGVDSAVSSLENINVMLQNVNEGTKKVVNAFEEVIAGIDEVSFISELNASSAEQSSASVEEQTASLQELTAETHNLSDLAEKMMDELNVFKLKPDEAEETS